MRALAPVLLLAVAAFVAWWVLSDRSAASRPPLPEPAEAPAAPAGPERPARTEAQTGFLVVRVRTAGGEAVPPKTAAGFDFLGSPRLRTVGEDGTVRFTDAPLGKVQATAEAEGYVATPVPVVVVAGIPAEAIVTLTPKQK